MIKRAFLISRKGGIAILHRYNILELNKSYIFVNVRYSMARVSCLTWLNMPISCCGRCSLYVVARIGDLVTYRLICTFSRCSFCYENHLFTIIMKDEIFHMFKEDG